MIAQRTPGRVSLRSTRWVPRLGRSRISSTRSPAHTPVALITVLARTVRTRTGAGVGEDGAGAGRLAHPDAGVHVGTLGSGGAGDREDQAYVVLELPVPGEQATTQPVSSYDGSEREGLGDPDPPRTRQGLPVGARAESQQVAGPKPGPSQRSLEAGDLGGQAASASAGHGSGAVPWCASGCRARRRSRGRRRPGPWRGSAARRAPASSSSGWCRRRRHGHRRPPPTARGWPRPARRRRR